MRRCFLILIGCVLLAGCGDRVARMEHAADPRGEFREQIAAAKQLLAQKEDWSDRAEWEVVKSGDGWQVIAWRIEHPEQKGAARYLPWGYSVIDLDRRSVAVGYHRKG